VNAALADAANMKQRTVPQIDFVANIRSQGGRLLQFMVVSSVFRFEW
jgi:hypothetical protein